MKDTSLIIKPFEFITVLECEITKKVNEHFQAKVTGYISDENADEVVLKCSIKNNFSIAAEDEDGTIECLFTGVIKDISVISENGLKKLVVHALSYTSLLDNIEKVRTFQNENQTYKMIAEFIASQYKNATFIYTAGSIEKTQGMIVQYKETDWEFLKRIASRLNTVLVPDCKNNNICICFGIPQKSKRVEVSSTMYSVIKDIDDYTIKKKNGINDIQEQDATIYLVKSRNIIELCSPVLFLQNQLFVYEIHTSLENGELTHTYYLKTKNGFKTILHTNNKIAGVSITGKVLKVKHDLVKVKIDSDDDRPDGVAKWFYYSTIYSSPNGTGWYCMPEIGDAIRVYFPDCEENDAYVISAIHLGKVNRMRKNPDEKSIRTIYNKEIRFTPSEILITNHDGLSIVLNDEKGIFIESNNIVNISSKEAVNIESDGEINIDAQMGIILQQGVNTIMVRDGIKEYALQIQHR